MRHLECRYCGTEFHTNSGVKVYCSLRCGNRFRNKSYEAAHRERLLEKGRLYRLGNPEKVRASKTASRLRHREARNARRRVRRAKTSAPVGSCEICGELDKLHWDHDHATDSFRGWICARCNKALAFARDDVDVLNNMIDYLSKTQTPIPDGITYQTMRERMRRELVGS